MLTPEQTSWTRNGWKCKVEEHLEKQKQGVGLFLSLKGQMFRNNFSNSWLTDKQDALSLGVASHS